MNAQNPFPAAATQQGYQVIASTCSETDQIRLYPGNLIKTVNVVNIPTVGLGLRFTLTHNSLMAIPTGSPVGNKWVHNYMRSLTFSGMPTNLVTYTDPSGRQFNFTNSGGPWGPSGTSLYTPATLVQNSNNWQLAFPDGSVHTFNTSGVLIASTDSSGNQTSFLYNGSGHLVTVMEPTGRTLTLGWTGGLITSVTDPNGNTTTLVYNLTYSNLTEIMGPAGCTIQYGYSSPSNSLITSRTDPNGNVYSYGYNGYAQLTSVTDAESPSHTISYTYDTVNEYVDDSSSGQSFSRTTLTDAFGNPWEYRFDQTGMLWRVIEPVDTTNSIYHWRRLYWDNNQNFLYATGGNPLISNIGGGGNMAGPRDSTNNIHHRKAYDPTLSVPLSHTDANGMDTQYTFNSARRMTSRAIGQGHFGIQGNWVGQYGSQGYILCAFDSASADVQSLPSYISSVSMGSASRVNIDNSDWYYHLMDPRLPVAPDSLHKGTGFWQSSSAFTMTFYLTEAQAFNLSFYANCSDMEYSENMPLLYNEQMGRDITYTVTDLSGTQSYRAYNNAGGHWMTIPVSGNSGTPVIVELTPSGANAAGDNPDARVSAIMFDSYDNHQTSYGYDSQNNMTSVTNGLGNTASSVYNSNGTLASSTDMNGNTTQYFYLDDHLNLTLVRDPYGFETTMTYDLNGNVLSKTDANGHTVTMTYDGKNRPLTVTTPLGFTTTTVYDSAGNVSTVTDANGNETQYFYTPTNRLKKVTDAASESTQYAFDAGGNPYTVTDPLSNVTTYAYDQSNQLLSTTRADGSIVSQSWDANSHRMATTSPNGNQSTIADISLAGAANFLRNPGFETVNPTVSNMPQSWSWSGFGSLDTSVSHSGQNSLDVQASTTAYGQWASQSGPFFPAGARGLGTFWALPDGSTNATTVQAGLYIYQVDASTVQTLSSTLSLPTSSSTWQQMPLFRVDVPGNSQFATSPISTLNLYTTSTTGTPDTWFDDTALYSLSTAMSYDNQGRLVQTITPNGAVTQRIYDRYGRLFQTIDANRGITQMGYDSLGRVTSLTDPLGNVTQYAYDAVGNRTSVTDPNSNVTQYQYDQKNRLVQITYPDASTELFVYDLVGNLTQYTNNLGQVFTMSYDAQNRLVERLYHTDNTTVQYGYDYVGNLISRVERNGDICWYTYDVVNRLVAVERNPSTGFSASASWLQRHVYDACGNRTEFDNGTAATAGVYGTAVYGTGAAALPPVQWTVPGGGYDDMNRLTAYEDASSNETTLSYDIESRVSGITFPNGSPPVATTVGYDMMSQLLSSATSQSSTSILPLTYGYDNNGNRLGMTTGTDTTYYTVDAANRLIQEDLNRFPERSIDRFVRGTVSGLDVTGTSLSLIALNDSFSGTSLNLDRWFSTYTNNSFTGGHEVRANGALLLTFPRGFCSTLTGHSNGVANPSPTLGFGLSPNYVWGGIQHRVPLTGDFDLQVSFNDFQGFPTGYTNSALTFMVTNTSAADVLDNGGNSFIIMRIDGTTEYESYISNNGSASGATSATSDTSGMLRIVRSGSTVNTYYWDSSAWQNLQTVTGYVSDTMYAALLTENYQVFVSASLSDFQSNLTAGQYGASGTYTSATFDAGRSATWDAIQWDATVPAGATLQFQMATSSSPTGPFTFVGPDGTSATYFTTSGTSIYSGTTGRYAQYQATLGGNGEVTPTVTRVDLLFAGANTSTAYTYSYDGAGNMTGKVTEVAGSTTVTETRTVNNLNQITANSVVGTGTTDWTFAYDANGNMTSRTNVTLSETTIYTWNDRNQLTNVSLPGGATVSYTYDVLGRMLSRTDSSGTTSFVWDSMSCVQETDPSGNVTRYYLTNGLMSFDRTVSGTTSVYQVHADAIGSVRKVTNSSGSVIATYDYDGWGNQLSSTSDSISNGGLQYRFVGAQGVRWDGATGLYYMRARWYDPTLGRFLSRDPLSSANRYQYAGNSPTVATDPTGKTLTITTMNPQFGQQFNASALLQTLIQLTGLPLTILPDGTVGINLLLATNTPLSPQAQSIVETIINDPNVTLNLVAGPAYDATGTRSYDNALNSGNGYGFGASPFVQQATYQVDPTIESGSVDNGMGYAFLSHALVEGYVFASQGANTDAAMTGDNGPGFSSAFDAAIVLENIVISNLSTTFPNMNGYSRINCPGLQYNTPGGRVNWPMK